MPPTPPPPPPPIRTDTRFHEPDEQSKAYLRKRIERDLPDMADDAQIVRDTILDSQPSESSFARAKRDYEGSIRELGQQEFPRQLRNEISERKWALDNIDSNSPDIVRQFQWIRQWILNSIRSRKIDNEQHSPFSPDAPPNSEEERSASPQQQSDSERWSDENSEDEEEERVEGDPTPHHYSPSPPSTPSTQSPHSKSPVSRRYVTSRKRQPHNFQLAKDNGDDNADDPHTHPPWRHRSQPYSLGGAPRRRNSGSQGRLVPHSLDEAISFPTPAGPSPEVYGSQRSPEDFSPITPQDDPRGWDTLNSRRSFGSFKPRLSPVDGDPSDDESDNIVGHPDVWQSVRSMKNLRSAMIIEQLTAWRKNEARRGEEATRREEEASRKEEEARRLEELARQSLEEAKCLAACARQTKASAKMHDAAAQIKEEKVTRKEAEVKKCEANVQKREAEAQRKEENARYRELEVRLKEEQACRKEEVAQRKEDDLRKREEEVRQMEEEARRLEESVRQSLQEAKRLEAGARQADAAAQNKEAEIKLKEVEVKKREADVQKREAEAQRKEEKIRYRELEAQRRVDDARKREEEACRTEKEACRLEAKARQSLEEAKRLEARVRQAKTFAEMSETDSDVENEEADSESKCDEIQANF